MVVSFHLKVGGLTLLTSISHYHSTWPVICSGTTLTQLWQLTAHLRSVQLISMSRKVSWWVDISTFPCNKLMALLCPGRKCLPSGPRVFMCLLSSHLYCRAPANGWQLVYILALVVYELLSAPRSQGRILENSPGICV